MSSSSPLPITVDTQAPLSINAQIAEQIKLLIAVGDLKPGDALPTVIQLAEYLQLNHNTIAAVYAQLIEAGYLVAQRGRGTFVANTEIVQQSFRYQHFYQLLEQAFWAANEMGLSLSDFGAVAYAWALTSRQRQVAPLRLVFVECLQHDAGSYFDSIKSEIDRSLVFLQLEDLQASQPVALQKLRTADLVITTAYHLWEVTQIAASEQEVIGVDARPNLQMLMQISALPRGTQVLLVHQGLVSSENMKQMLKQAGVSHLNLQAVSIECIQQNPQLLDRADVVYASQLVYDYVREVSPQSEKVMSFSFSIAQASLAVLKARLTAIQLSKLNQRPLQE